MDAKKTLIIIDELLEKIDGHNFEYIKSVKEIYEAKGFEVIVYGNSEVIKEIKTEIHAIPFFTLKPKVWYRNIFIVGSILYRFTFWVNLHKKYKAIIKKTQAQNVTYFVPNLYWFNILPIIIAFKNIKTRSIFLLRLSITDKMDIPKMMHKLVDKIYSKCAKIIQTNKYIFMCTDSVVIAKEWKNNFASNMAVLPIPHIKETKNRHTEVATSNLKKLYAPGVMRLEKGMQLLFDSLQIIELEHVALAQQLEFIVQIFGDREKAYFDNFKLQLSKFKHVKITILGSLSSTEYNYQINNADIILLPYVAIRGYQARTSGVLCEAIGAEKVFITSTNTWMENVSNDFNTGKAVPENVSSFIAGIEYLLSNFVEFENKAIKAKKLFLEFHNSNNFYKLLESQKN